MKAKKENKVYDINEAQKQSYLDQGYDIYDDKGDIIEYTPLKTIKYSKHLELLKKAEDKKNKEIEELKKQLKEAKKNAKE